MCFPGNPNEITCEEIYLILRPRTLESTIEDIVVHCKNPTDLYRVIKGMETNEIYTICIMQAQAQDTAKHLIEEMRGHFDD